MTPDAFDAGLVGFALGFLVWLVVWTISAPRRRPIDQIRERFTNLALGVAAALPEPADEEVRRMVADARMAANRTVPYALDVIRLGALVLRLRRAPKIVGNSPPACG